MLAVQTMNIEGVFLGVISNSIFENKRIYKDNLFLIASSELLENERASLRKENKKLIKNI